MLSLLGRPPGFRAVAFIAALGAAAPAFAHDETNLVGGLLAGLAHPLTGVDHLLAMVSVGIWGAILRRPSLVVLPVVFPVMMAIGGLFGVAGVPFPPVELGIALSVLLLGATIAAEWRAPVWAAVLLVGAFALFHGYAHGRELPAAADPILYSIGFMLATGSLHIAGIAIGLVRDRPGGTVVTRWLGATIAAAGCVFLWRVLA